MMITRVIALTIAAGTFGLSAVPSQSQAQSQSSAGLPAEFPPASYRGKQYVDSKGCVFIRAGIDGNVTWVPRVSRSRKQLCGQQPTAVAGATRSPSQGGPAPQLITLPASQQPSTPAPAPAPTRPATAVASTSAPTTPAPTKPQRPSATASAAPVAAPVRAAKPAPQSAVAAAPAVSAARAPVATAASPASGGCANASALSQQYTNQGARCGPQAVSPVTFGTGSGVGPQSSLRLTPNTRVVPTHVYQARRHSQAVTPPSGYRAVWQDDRLNLQRAERGLKPAIISGMVQVPAGYVLASREDDRLNSQRATRTAEGDAQSDLIWTRTVPRKLVALPLDRPVVSLPTSAAVSQAEVSENLVLHLSTRSAPAPRRYVRAATFSDPAAARAAAQGLAARGLSVRLGSVTRKGKMYKVVLAGPYTDTAAAEAALTNVRAAGYSGARLSK
ncbi:SPOR domain-containing protein [Parasedimentitalea psychrophila]|uniref:SPOR domain-containing protein n=1 Tax=Parasedimentitalea psychrophila TaxID=2997337 RepID=A0A9Y2L1V8_9RHOB|nr:SPOR domain-containing protein [Parasedimentitalea psychrophila]WIY25339.1 SPOR domain-containing protein [Parasedimentitalea psychrophila]